MASSSEPTQLEDDQKKVEEAASPVVEDSKKGDGETKTEDRELDDLLDSALEDFDKCSQPVTPKSDDKTKETVVLPQESAAGAPPLPPPPPQMLPNPESLFGDLLGGEGDMTAEVSAEIEKAMQAFMTDLSRQQPDDPALAEQLQKLVEASDSDQPVEGGATGGPADFSRTLGETMNRLAQNASELQTGQFSEDELKKAMEGMRLEDGMEGDTDFMPMIQSMMKNLLSKEVIYPSMKEIVEKYPQWLEENKEKTNTEDYSRYQKQFDMMRQLCNEYESESSTDSEDVKKQRFDRIMIMVQEMEALGQPPKELVGEMAPGLEFDAQGNPKLPGLPSPDQCIVM
ncbi:peroxisomal biogenesis factor 19-like [Glandiceps talaboti]